MATWLTAIGPSDVALAGCERFCSFSFPFGQLVRAKTECERDKGKGRREREGGAA